MQPQQQQSSDPTPQMPQGNYDFIFTPPEQPKGPVSLNVAGNKKFLIAGAALIILLVVGILAIVLNSGGNPATTQLVSVAAEQQEIIRISDVALKTSKNPSTLATATTVKSSVTSELNQTLAIISSSGIKLEKGQLAAKQNKKTDEALASAAQSNTFDSAYNDYLSKNLKSYQTELKELHAIGGPKSKELASSAYDSTELILISI